MKLCAGAFAVAALLMQPVRAADITFVTEEYAPFNYSENGEIKGIAVEQVRQIASAAGLDHTIQIMPWARAIALAEHQSGHCVFTTGHNQERHHKFHWVEPLLKDQMILVKRKGDDLAVTTLEQARGLRVGAQRGDFAVEALKARGFTEIDLAADLALTLGKLKTGRIDLMPTSVKTFEKLIQSGEPVERAMVLDGQIYGIACNLDLPEATVTALQQALNELITSGGQDEIFAAYGLPPNTRTAAR